MAPPLMMPAPGECLFRFVGDRVAFTLRGPDGGALPAGWRARLRTNLGRAAQLRAEILRAHERLSPLEGTSWRDIPFPEAPGSGVLDLPVTEVGYFQAKAYAVDRHGRQYWPDGPNVGITVHPNDYRTANLLYCAFVRQFNQTQPDPPPPPPPEPIAVLDKAGFTAIPPSGKLRQLTRSLPHIFDALGCRILHLLPVNPTPTTFARFGRFGSPYAALDLMAVDPALVEFDRRTTGVDQFRELTEAVHARGGRLFLDLAINHTGWGASLQETHPEWYLRDGQGQFVCPGAWGTIWEDLCELDHHNPALWAYLAEVFLVWCRRGVDGFRCDAGYKITVAAWRCLIAAVRREFPETLFFLEGLGGSWEATESLLTEGGMQWAYSELFQNYSASDVSRYLDYSLGQSRRAGLWVHYSETHDNPRLARQGRPWSLLRNQLCALTSVSGAYGFTAGVEWLATERIDVHQNRSLAWGQPHTIIPELRHLNRLLAEHPAFFDHARLTCLSAPDSAVYALRRDSAAGADRLLVLINLDPNQSQVFRLPEPLDRELDQPRFDLLTQAAVPAIPSVNDAVEFAVPPGGAFCLSAQPQPRGLSGEEYRQARAQAAWGFSQLSRVLPIEKVGPLEWPDLARRVAAQPRVFLAALARLPATQPGAVLGSAASEAPAEPPLPLSSYLDLFDYQGEYCQVVDWTPAEVRRVTPVPPRHWLFLQDTAPFTARLDGRDGQPPQTVRSIAVSGGHIAAFYAADSGSSSRPEDAELRVDRHVPGGVPILARIRFLPGPPAVLASPEPALPRSPLARTESDRVLLTNGRGGMARLYVDLGRVASKYDCLLGANLDPGLPTDRQILAKRARVWVNADGFITPLNLRNLVAFRPGPPAHWQFRAGAGDGRVVEIHLTVDLWEDRNTALWRLARPLCSSWPAGQQGLPDSAEVRLTVRVDLEDRNFHSETHRNPAADHHFNLHCHALADPVGFIFEPAPDRRLRVTSDSGCYHPEPEWCQDLAHPLEQNRGQVDRGDAYSPGWFDLPLPQKAVATLVLDAEAVPLSPRQQRNFVSHRDRIQRRAVRRAGLEPEDRFGSRLAEALEAFVVRRDAGKTVIAGYPWFLDWGRDTLICARGLLAAGRVSDVLEVLATFGRWIDRGTLPNRIAGADTANRDTSDAPLWFARVCEETAAMPGIDPAAFYQTVVGPGQRTLAEALREIAVGYLAGTPNGIRVDPASGLVWSPAHFTWMDTNHPAGTPREGYPVEIQALWIALLRQGQRCGLPALAEDWAVLADRAAASFEALFWLENEGYWADLLIAPGGLPAAAAVADRALRSNFLVGISLGLATGSRAQRAVQAAQRFLVIPGAVRSLAPLPVTPPLPIRGADGQLLNQPNEPYWGRYEGDEDTRRKPAYHNGTAWVWTLPLFCEALVRAWNHAPQAQAAARAYLLSLERLLDEECLGQLPEILDGDAPHQARGCDAQAWSISEALRVWKWLNGSQAGTPPAP